MTSDWSLAYLHPQSETTFKYINKVCENMVTVYFIDYKNVNFTYCMKKLLLFPYKIIRGCRVSILKISTINATMVPD